MSKKTSDENRYSLLEFMLLLRENKGEWKLSYVYDAPEGWFYSEKWGIYQKTKGRVYAYVTIRLFDGYQVQLYERGMTGMCELEFRSHSTEEVFKIGEEWLESYQAGNMNEVRKNVWSPWNKDGYWVKKSHR